MRKIDSFIFGHPSESTGGYHRCSQRNAYPKGPMVNVAVHAIEHDEHYYQRTLAYFDLQVYETNAVIPPNTNLHFPTGMYIC